MYVDFPFSTRLPSILEARPTSNILTSFLLLVNFCSSLFCQNRDEAQCNAGQAQRLAGMIAIPIPIRILVLAQGIVGIYLLKPSGQENTYDIGRHIHPHA